MWSVGVTWLELILGTPHVFQLSARQRALLHHHLKLEDKSEVGPVLEIELMRPRLDAGGGLASWDCSHEAVRETLRQRDPTHQGLPSDAALDLLKQMLHWDPQQRPTPERALQHPYFQEAV
eukprot:jgi/Astpho2/99/e_gw1.00004.112.1_t